MAASIPALVNPSLLAWARQVSGYAPEPAAKRLHVRSDRLLSWERGVAKPTVRQAVALAKLCSGGMVKGRTTLRDLFERADFVSEDTAC